MGCRFLPIFSRNNRPLFAQSFAAYSQPSSSSSATLHAIDEHIDVDGVKSCKLEFLSGIGGKEASLFAVDLFNMYEQFAIRNDWEFDKHQVSKGDKRVEQGIRSALVTVRGELCYSKLRFEGGVHKVQRIPLTEKRNKIQSSTVQLIVMPEPEKPEVMFSPDQLKEEVMRGSGAGGQNVNSINSTIRLTHLPTGISVKVSEERHLTINRKVARERLASILMKQKVDEIAMRFDTGRKLQVSTLDRSEKIRAYHFRDNRVTDYRTKLVFTDVPQFMQGGEDLEQVIETMMELYELESMEREQQRHQQQQQ